MMMSLMQSLNKLIEEYDKVALVVDGEGMTEYLTDKVRDYLSNHQLDTKLLVLSKTNSQDSDALVGLKAITAEEEQELLELYNTYEFSDRFMVIRESSFCGNLFNYVKGGLLNWDEALDALFCEKEEQFKYTKRRHVLWL